MPAHCPRPGRSAVDVSHVVPGVATYVHTSAMGVGLTSLGHPWTGRRRPHTHNVIGDPADTTPTAHSVRHRRPQGSNNRGPRAIGWSHGGAAEC